MSVAGSFGSVAVCESRCGETGRASLTQRAATHTHQVVLEERIGLFSLFSPARLSPPINAYLDCTWSAGSSPEQVLLGVCRVSSRPFNPPEQVRESAEQPSKIKLPPRCLAEADADN